MKRISGLVGVLVLVNFGFAAPAAAPLAPQGLQAEWTFAEGSGTAAGDSSGNGFSGTLTNGLAWAPGRIGNAISFDGVNDFVNLGDNRSLVQNAPAATVALWIKPSSVIPSGAFRELVSLSVGAATPTNTSRIAFSLKGDGTTGGDLFAGGRSTDSESQKTLESDANVVVGTWAHIVAVVDFTGNKIQIYKDGVLVATNSAAGFAQATTANTPSRSCSLGAQDSGDSNYYQGAMDEVRIYNRALSASEIQVLATGDSLGAHWKLDDGAGLTAADSSGNSNPGTLKNGLDTGWVSGQVGGALRFDGVDDYVQVDAPGIVRNVNAATVAAWIKPSSTLTAGTFRELVSISVGGAPSDVSRFALALRGDGTAGDIFLGGRASDSETQKSLVADVNLPAGTYSHVAGIVNFAQGTLEVYINGLLAASGPAAFVQPFTTNTASASIALGAQDTGGSNRYAGDMDEVRVYGRALSACEIQELAGRDGLQAHWKFDEVSGTTAADSSPTGLTAILKNGASFVAGKLGNAMNLDGVDDYADLGLNLPILKNSNAATVAAWINLTSLPASGAFREIVSIAVGGSPSNTSRLALAVKGDGSAADLFAGGRSTDTEAQQTLTADAANIQAGVWRHVAATLDIGHNQIRIYLDGALIASGVAAFSQATTATTPPANGALGAQDLGNSNFNHLKMDDVRIYCRVLSAAEVASLAASVAPSAPVLSLVEQGNQQVKLSWTSVPGADFYNLKRSTTQGTGYVTIATLGSTTYTDQGLTNGTTYYYVVTAQNAAGESTISNEVNATPAAGVPPAPLITSPASGAILNTSTPTVSGSSSSAGLTITLLVNGIPNGTTTSGVAGNWSLTPAGTLAEGLHSLTATAANGSGTSSASGAVSIRIDTIPPVISSPQPANGSSTTDSTPTISASWSDPSPASGINTASAVIKLDNLTVSPSVTATGFSFTPSALSLGLHTVSAQVNDLAGNSSATLTWSFTVVSTSSDSVPPVISNLLPPTGGFTNNVRPQLYGTISDSGGSGIHAASVTMVLNSIVVPAAVVLQDVDHATVAFTPNFDLGQGQNTLTINGSDVAGNPAVEAGSVFVVDSVVPTISLTSPLPGSTFGSLAVSLAAQIADDRSGIVPGSVTVLLNTADVTGSVTLAPGSLNSFGFPNQISISGTLTAIPGSNMLHLFATDPAGNLVVVTSTFSAQGPPVPPPPMNGETIVITKVKGDAQEGLVDDVLKDSLVVQVTANGQPLTQFRLLFEVVQGDGQIVGSLEGKRWGTDDSGMAGISFIPKLGSNVIRVTPAQSAGEASAQFTVTGKNPTVELIPTPIPTQPPFIEFGHYGIPGGALVLPRIFQAKDHEGNPKKNIVIKPGILNSGGDPLQDFSHIGYFVPEYALSDSDGKAEFAFRIANGASAPQTISMCGFLPRFKDEAGNPPRSGPATGDILDPNSRPRRVTLSAPQAQVCLPQQLMPQDLAITIDNGTILRMCISWGEGSLLPGSGDFYVSELGPNGDIRYADSQMANGATTTIRYRKGGKNVPAIIALYSISSPGIFVQSYVIAPTEIAIVRRAFQKNSDGTLLRDSQGEPTPMSGPPYEKILQPRDYIPHAPFFDPNGGIQSGAPEFEIFLEARLPVGTAQASASLKTIALDGGAAPTPPGALIPLQLSLNLTNGEPDPDGRFILRRSDPTLCVAPFSVGGSVPSGTETPAGQKLIHCPNDTLVECKMTAPLEQQAENKKTVPPLVVLIGVDGMGQDMYTTAKNRIENDLLKDIGGNTRALEIQNVQTVYPSVTYTAVGSILDGKSPRETGARTELFVRNAPLTIPYLRNILDAQSRPTTRRHFALAAGANPRVMDGFNAVMAGLANHVASSPTLRSGGFMNTTNDHEKGSWAVFTANYYPPIGEGRIGGGNENGQIGPTGEYYRVSRNNLNMDLFEMAAYWSFLRLREQNVCEALDQNTFDLARERAKGKTQRHFYVWFSGYDHFAHDGAGFDTVLTEYLGNTLVQGAGVVNAFDNKLREYVTFAFFSDHGTTKLSKNPANVIDFKTEMLPLLTSQGRKVFSDPGPASDREENKNLDDVDTVVLYHDIMAEVFLKELNSNWNATPPFGLVLQVADVFLRANAGTIGTGFTGKIDMILVRDSTGANGFDAQYRVYESSQTLLNPVATPPTTLDAWALANPRPQYVTNYIDHLKSASFVRSGDIMLIPKFPDEVAGRVQFFRESEHGHGGLSKREMLVPLVIGYAGTAKAMREITLGKAAQRRTALQAANSLNMTNFDAFILDMLDIKK